MEIIITLIVAGVAFYLGFLLIKFLISSGALFFMFKYIALPLFVGVLVNVLTESMGIGVGGGILTGAICSRV